MLTSVHFGVGGNIHNTASKAENSLPNNKDENPLVPGMRIEELAGDFLTSSGSNTIKMELTRSNVGASAITHIRDSQNTAKADKSPPRSGLDDAHNNIQEDQKDGGLRFGFESLIL